MAWYFPHAKVPGVCGRHELAVGASQPERFSGLLKAGRNARAWG
ncbi:MULTISPECIES: hypothetical protein [Comamonas]|nr:MULTISPECIES: hypothetical protein [Comamonas]